MILRKIETERMILRPFSTSDLAHMQQLDLDKEVVHYLGSGKIKTSDEIEKNLLKILQDYQSHGLGLFAAFEKSTDEFIGRSGLIPWSLEGTLTWEIGYSFIRSAWGKGFATEAAAAFSEWAEKNLKVPYVVSLIHPQNEASIRVAEKIGMRSWKEINILDRVLISYKKDFSG